MKSFTLVLAALCLAHSLSAAETQIIVEAGDYDRRDTVVEFKLPSDVKSTALVDGAGGKSTGLQITPMVTAGSSNPT